MFSVLLTASLFLYALFAALQGSILLMALVIPLILLLVALLPCFTGNESLGVFLLTAAMTLPANIRLSASFAAVFSAHLPWVGQAACAVVFFSILLCGEEVLCVLASRLLWPYQQALLDETVWGMD